MEVHTIPGPGLLESAYEMSLQRELRLRGLKVRRQVALPLVYKDVKCAPGYRLDLLVEDKEIVEIKAVEALNEVHLAQVLTYLKLSDRSVGLLITFNGSSLKNGIKRIVNNFVEYLCERCG